MATKPAGVADRSTPLAPAAGPEAGGDIRSARPLALSRSRLTGTLRRGASIGALIFLDLCGLALGLYAALVVRALYYGDPLLWGALWKIEAEWLPFLSLITVLVFWQAGLYRKRERRTGMGRIARSLVLVTLLTLAFAVGTDHEFATYGLAPTAFGCTVLIIGLLRASYEICSSELLRQAGVRRRAILVGPGPTLVELRRKLGSGRAGIDYEFLGVLSDSQDGTGLPALGPIDALPQVLESRAVDELIVSDPRLSDRELIELAEHAHQHGTRVRVAPSTAEILIQRGEYVPGQGVPLFELHPPAFGGMDWAVKRAFDFFVSLAILIVALPLWIAIALAVKLDSRGPVFYRDHRIGVNEREFSMFKFRTMRADADEHQEALEALNTAGGALFKVRDDPRITRVGTILRRFSLDEIPQVLNVLRGEMSLVGPRPLPIRDHERLEAWHRKRYLVLPGMTGLWQISGRSELGFDDLVRLDFYYLENWTLWLDISILVKTIPAVAQGRGAF